MSAPKASRIPAGDKGTADRIEADQGHYWVRLTSWQALDREGACMGHCVGGGQYDDLVGGENITDRAVWSLRRPSGVSVLTVLIRYCTLDLAKGAMNSTPGRFEAMQVRHLVAAFRAVGYEFLVDASTGITLLKDGRTFRADRLPPDAGPIRAAASSEISFSVEDPGAHADSGAFEARPCSNDGDSGTAHSAPVATTDREARRAALRAMISPEAQRRRQLQDEAYDRDIARILGRAA